jgi:hypothetical protein
MANGNGNVASLEFYPGGESFGPTLQTTTSINVSRQQRAQGAHQRFATAACSGSTQHQATPVSGLLAPPFKQTTSTACSGSTPTFRDSSACSASTPSLATASAPLGNHRLATTARSSCLSTGTSRHLAAQTTPVGRQAHVF